MPAQLWPGGFDPLGLLRLRTSLFSFSPRPLVSRSQGQVGTTPPYCRREPPTRRTSRAVPCDALYRAASNSYGRDCTRLFCVPVPPPTSSREPAESSPHGFAQSPAALRAYGGKLCQSPRSLGASQVAPCLAATRCPSCTSGEVSRGRGSAQGVGVGGTAQGRALLKK